MRAEHEVVIGPLAAANHAEQIDAVRLDAASPELADTPAREREWLAIVRHHRRDADLTQSCDQMFLRQASARGIHATPGILRRRQFTDIAEQGLAIQHIPGRMHGPLRQHRPLTFAVLRVDA